MKHRDLLLNETVTDQYCSKIYRTREDEFRINEDGDQELRITGVDSVSLDKKYLDIKLIKLKNPISSMSIIQRLQEEGVTHNISTAHIYNESIFGKFRPQRFTDESATMRTPVTENITVSELRNSLDPLLRKLESFFPGDNLPKDDEIHLTSLAEEDDFTKLAFQHIKPYGFHIDFPLVPENVRRVYHPRFLRIIELVISTLAHNLIRTGKTDPDTLSTVYTEPDSTNTGAPFFVPGSKDTDVYRMAIAALMPRLDINTRDSYYDEYVQAMQSLGVPGEFATGSFLVTRTGPFRKPVPIMKLTSAGFVANYAMSGFSARMRFAWGGPYSQYLSTGYAGGILKLSRMATLGLYHTEALQSEYFPKLNFSPGRVTVSNDFSQYDRSISLTLQLYMLDQYAKYFPSYYGNIMLLRKFLQNTKMIMPNFLGENTQSVSVFSGSIPLLSGINITPEIGTVLGVASTLHVLEEFLDKDIVRRWQKGEFVILEQSDDNLYVVSIDQARRLAAVRDEIKEFVWQNHGFRLKMNFGNVFLKRIIPHGCKTLHDTAPVIARVIQNTFANEYALEGKYAKYIAQFGFIARTTGLLNHPMIKKDHDLLNIVKATFRQFPVLWEVAPYIGQPVTSLPATVLNGILEYSKTAQGQKWLDEMIMRASFDVNAQATLSAFEIVASDIMQRRIIDKVARRKSFIRALVNKDYEITKQIPVYRSLLHNRIASVYR